MPTPTNPSENQSTYFINPEEAAETARLLQQDRSITKEMGSLFPVSLDLSHIHTVLDLACGPGGWAFDVARVLQLLLPFLLRMGVTTQEEFDHIYQQIGVEMQEPEFRGLFFLLSARGEKPQG